MNYNSLLDFIHHYPQFKFEYKKLADVETNSGSLFATYVGAMNTLLACLNGRH